ncbi:MAG: hypothetical protein KMY55_01465 [Dethiosulfatibacter sp.]|nr:hypothetical protein [Dethiosulfatibacter sp.]
MKKEIIFIMDRSGSMAGSESDTIGGYNTMIIQQNEEDGEANLTTTLFDREVSFLHDGVNIKTVKPITNREYFVRGSTALFDAVGETIIRVSERIKYDRSCSELEADNSKNVLCVIMTDGYENASRKFTKTDVKNLIAEKELIGWEFIYLGADIKDSREAERMGIKQDNSHVYRKENQRQVYENLSDSIMSFRKDNKLSDKWKDNAKSFQCEVPYIDCPEGCFIIDTGSPMSFGEVSSVTIKGRRHRIGQSPIMVDVQNNLGRQIKGIIGTDILKDYDIEIRFDRRENRFLVDLELYNLERRNRWDYTYIDAKSMKNKMGVPVITINIKEKTHQFFLDTGSTITYMRNSIIDTNNYCGSKNDFYPLLGSFKTDLFRSNVSIDGSEYELEVGALPSLLNLLLPSDIDGIIGSDLIKQATLKILHLSMYELITNTVIRTYDRK